MIFIAQYRYYVQLNEKSLIQFLNAGIAKVLITVRMPSHQRFHNEKGSPSSDPSLLQPIY